jgi:hypothetical protein
MLKITFLAFVVITLTACDAHKIKCSQICPRWEYGPDELMGDALGKYFKVDGPEDGICVDGLLKFILLGSQFATSDVNRCICVPSLPSQYKLTCEPDLPVCKRMILGYADELASRYWLRHGEVGDKYTPDGCCPPGQFRYILPPSITGYKGNICHCSGPQLDIEGIQRVAV